MGLRTSLLHAFGFGTAAQAPEAPRKRRRMYAGAALGRLTADWFTGQTSADAEIKSSLKRLRDRSRQLVRDNPYARQAKRACQMNVIGHGIQMQAHVMRLRGKKRDQILNQQIEDKWNAWCQKDSCDVAGKNSFRQMQFMASGALPESGEVFFRIVRRNFGKSKIPVALQIIEADMLDDEYQGATQKNSEWRMGVEVNEWGRPLRYAFFTKHPGDSQFVGTREEAGRHILIAAEDIIHLFMPERPGQTRGVPWFAPVMDDCHQMQGYEEAAVIRARGAASLMGFIESPEGELEGDDVEDEQRLTDFAPGQFRYLNPGEKVEIPQITAPDAQYEMFVRQKTRRFAAGFGCSYETISRDHSQTNYSSSRLSLLEDREHWRVIQDYLIENFLHRVFVEWLGAAVLAGELNLPDYELRPERYEASIKWQPRGWSWVDPLKEAQAYSLMEDRGYMTKAQICGLLGSDLEENLRELAFEKQMANELGLEVSQSSSGNSDNESSVIDNTDETE